MAVVPNSNWTFMVNCKAEQKKKKIKKNKKKMKCFCKGHKKKVNLHTTRVCRNEIQ